MYVFIFFVKIIYSLQNFFFREIGFHYLHLEAMLKRPTHILWRSLEDQWTTMGELHILLWEWFLKNEIRNYIYIFSSKNRLYYKNSIPIYIFQAKFKFIIFTSIPVINIQNGGFSCASFENFASIPLTIEKFSRTKIT